MSELGGALLMTGLLIGATGLVLYSRVPVSLKLLVVIALLLRVTGAGVRYWVLKGYYGGVGDATGYYSIGLSYAERFLHLDFSPLFDSSQWRRTELWGTQFVYYPSAIVLMVLGPGMLTEFVAFSILSFIGLIGFVLAFHHTYPDRPVVPYARWVWLFPSLWFWPSSVGKEALVLLGLGLAVAGFAQRRKRPGDWLVLLSGAALVFAVRPQVAAVLLLSLVFGHWIASQRRLSGRSLIEGALILTVGLAGVSYSLHSIGAGGFDVEGVQSYMESDPARRVGGGSGIDAPTLGLAGVPEALVNILLRPFPWEVSNPMVLFSCLEVLLLWAVVWRTRDGLLTALRNWRSDRLVAVALAFILIYAVMLGLMVTNLGILARQRLFLYPFIFILLEAGSRRHLLPPPTTTAQGPASGGQRGAAIRKWANVEKQNQSTAVS